MAHRPSKITRLHKGNFGAALEQLATLDPAMAKAMDIAGRPALRRRPAQFSSLANIIVEQQISVAAGRTICARLAERFDGANEQALAKATEEQLRDCGLTRQKASYCRGLAIEVCEGRLDLQALAKLDDLDARAELVRQRGIGPWTADIYLMFVHGRADIWPVGDLALQEGARRLKRLRQRPDEKRLLKLGKAWTPLRSAASLVLWRYYTHCREQDAIARKS